MEKIKLTQYSKSAGCGCKIAPEALQQILSGLHTMPDKNLLVGNESNDDAAVYDIGNGQCVISTTDFFMPIVDNSFDFGKIAAANSISDIYAMGGKPVMAIAILGWPIDKIPASEAQRVLQGAIEICKKAGIPLAGGHSIDNPEPVFGLAVTGLVQKNNIKKNNTCEEGDLLYLTKPLGSGILATALKRGKLNETHYTALLNNMITLNTFGSICGELDYIHAMTDVTGFGLLGHLCEMLENKNFSATIEVNKIPLLEGVETYSKEFIYPDNTTRNYNSVKEKVKWVGGLEFITLCDPQTSGGLLISVSADKKAEFETKLKENNQEVYLIGKINLKTDTDNKNIVNLF
ncbi:MAG TPA: selenide, water dikinase SelD [Bacteroidia bacterium]|nr:selenide, water dikinase SelD [Bacteroidia bacterium]